MLKDTFNRTHDYLRISLTDACNFRCLYCMPNEQMKFMPAKHLMQADEIEILAKTFVELGVKKIRLTGGEPLVRKDAKVIVARLSQFPVELTLTTNAALVDKFIDVFHQAGIKSINVSLDTLQKDKFLKLSKRDLFEKVWNNIQLLIEEGFHVKVNVVVMKGINNDEILDFIEWTKNQPVHVRFIEFMPFDKNQWNSSKVFSYQEILNLAETQFSFIKMKDGTNETAKKFKPFGHQGTFAVISTMSAPFCLNCNRIRLTADGKMKNCLFSKGEADILTALRNQEDIVRIIKTCVGQKEKALGGQFEGDFHKIDTTNINNRSMIRIGG
ncbi:MAG: GTP 3',8-cyclase MoaA [Flavobacteriales bacterium CG_4_9_14_3_um_filter_40_17]|nr:MAG: GTP 3',8-cyclase MoaA [Flavobacteriales bacterium CG_4_9_14_3_um_filter_40_17]